MEPFDNSIEALRIMLEKKNGTQHVEAGEDAFRNNRIAVTAHVANIGWMAPVGENRVSGTIGLSNPVEGIIITLNDADYTGGILYKTYVQSIGWEKEWRTSGELSGTTGQNKHIEAIQIALTGQLANHYDIYYQTHVNSIGWLGFASNGDYAGTENYGEAIDALRIILVQKGKSYPVSDALAYFARPDAGEFAKSHSQDVADGEYYIVDSEYGIYYLNYSDEGRPAIYTFNNMDPDKWIISHDAEGYVLVKHKDTGEYLSVGNENNRTIPKWVFVKDEDGYILMPEAVENHLSITGESLINGNSLTTTMSTDKELRHWKLVSALDVQSMFRDLVKAGTNVLKDDIYEIVNNGNQSIAIAADNKNNTSNIQMQTLSDSDNQYWQIEHDDDGFATIFSRGAQKYLTVGEKDIVGLSDLGGKIEAKWIILPTASGYQIISAANPYAVLIMNESKGYAGNSLVSEEADLTLANTWCLSTKTYSTIRRETMGHAYDMDGWYGAQCLDYVDHVMIHYYGSYNGVACLATGYVQDVAANKAWNGILDFMDDVTGEEMEQGDIVVWGFCDACPYSHIALYDRQGVGDKIYVLGQNQPYPYVNVLSVSKEGVIGVFRPKKFYNV